MKKIGILTSGGDCGGLNAAVRSIFFRAKNTYQMEVMGIRDGTVGLMQRPVAFVPLDYQTFSGSLLRQGGTFLGTTSKGNPFKFPMPDGGYKDRSQDIIDGYKELELDGLIVIGGDGSMSILTEIAKRGDLNIVAIPKTIDNDVGATESSIGFNTAVNVATQALDNLQTTAASHQRTMILEVMGRDAGHIALNAGIAGGADIILIPEIPYSLKSIARHIEDLRSKGRNHALIVVAEAVKKENGKKATVKYVDGEVRLGGIGNYLGDEIYKITNSETRVTVLGHVQRGAQPTHRDRLIASAFGVYATDLIANKKFNRVVVWKDRGVQDLPLNQIAGYSKTIQKNDPLIKVAKGLGIYIGELI